MVAESVAADRRARALERARVAHAARAAADADYRRAVAEAVAAGASYADLSAVLGISRQAVRQLVLRR